MTKTESAEHLVKTLAIESCEQWLEFHGAEGVRAAIPNTNKLIMVGPQEWIAENVLAVEAMVEATGERSMFEYAERASNLTRSEGDGDYYENPCVQSAWEGWQARARIAATTQASTAQAEPVMWFEAESSARGLEAKDVIGSMLYSTRIHTGAAPITSNPVWPLYAAPLTATSSTDAQAAAEVREPSELQMLVRMYRRHEEWARRSGYVAMDWQEFKESRRENPLSARALRAGDTGGAQ